MHGYWGRTGLMIKHATWVFVILLVVSALADFPVLVQAQGGPWTKYSGNPILSPTRGTWDADYIILPTVVFVPSIGYMMWYVGSSQKVTGIGFASSPDGYTWIKHTGPVLTPGSGRCMG